MMIGVIFPLLLFFTQGNAAPPPACTMSEDDFDTCALHVMTFGNDDMLIPTTDAEMDKHCEDIMKNLQCLRQYAATCMVDFPKTVFGVFQYDHKRELKSRCHTADGRAEFMKHMKCGKDKGGFGPIHQCVRNYDAQMEWIIANVPKENQVVSMCCSLHWVHRCIITKSKELCESVTGPETSEYFDRMVGSSISEGVEFTCGVHKSYDDCAAHLDQNTWKMLLEIGEDPSKANFVPRYKSPITTAIKMFSQLNH